MPDEVKAPERLCPACQAKKVRCGGLCLSCYQADRYKKMKAGEWNPGKSCFNTKAKQSCRMRCERSAVSHGLCRPCYERTRKRAIELGVWGGTWSEALEALLTSSASQYRPCETCGVTGKPAGLRNGSCRWCRERLQRNSHAAGDAPADIAALVAEVERLRARLDEQRSEHIAKLRMERDGNAETMGHVVEVIRHALGFMIDEKPQRARSILSFALGCYCGEESWDRLVGWLRESNQEEVPGA